MTSTHRPLSGWIARVGPDGSLGLINGGRERADARGLQWFATEWTRSRTGEPPALALVEADTGAVVVELDNYSIPIPVSAAGLAIIEQAERQWPHITEESDWSALADESPHLRYLVLKRLTAEADQPLSPWLFHILDWNRVNDLTARLTRLLGGGPIEGTPVSLRHLFSPAVPGLTSALEQIDAGYQEDIAEVRRQGFEALIAAVRASAPDRLPRSTRAALMALLAAVAETARTLRVAVRETGRHLVGNPAVTFLGTDLLDPLFEPAAAGEDREQEATPLGEPGFAITVIRSARGRLMITATIEPDGEDLTFFLPIRILVPGTTGQDRRLWIALSAEGTALSGTVDLPLPSTLFEVTAADFPVTAAALRFTAATELLESLRAADFATASVWLDTAGGLAEGHPVKEAARLFEEEQ